ncbi:MAG: quinone oxidoreductase [Alphaproteobacteria bacterium]|nr:quinone oxidoreductase [Alphaproteobacteria bacterium]
MKARAFRIERPGGPEAMTFVEITLGRPARGEVLVRHTAIGVNMVDVYMREGTHHTNPFPAGIGIEAVGVIEAIGPGVTRFKPGDRVAYSGGPGAYAEARVCATRSMVRLPSWLDDRSAAALYSKGKTVHYLFHRTHRLKRGETILFHAAAGGVGLIACQWAKAIGARMIGTVGTEEKARLARRYGCTHPVVLSKQDLVAAVMRLTKGAGVDVVYDSIGKDYWQTSLDAVRRLGLVVCFGFSSGPPPPFDIDHQGSMKSIYVTRATTKNYMVSDADDAVSARALFAMVRKGTIKARIGQTYALKDAAQAHRDLVQRRTTGSTILIP